MLRLPPSVLPLLLLLFLLGACTDARPSPAAGEERSVEAGPRIRAVTLDAPELPPPGALEHLRDLGATHLTLIPFGFQSRPDVPEIRHHTDGRWYSESDAGIRALARAADSLGMEIILKPHLWIREHDGEGQRRDRIGFASEADWQRWEAAYRSFLLHYARLSEEIGAPLLVIGTELAGPVRARPAFWRRLIEEIRSVYSGKLTYAANWYEEYEHISFWDALDYIGVQAYFPLSQAEDPSLDLLERGWTPHLRALERLQGRVGRPVFFTEIGYRSVSYAAAEPWRWPSRAEEGTLPPDPALQARLYEAFFSQVWDRPWFAGAVIWKWHPAPRRARRALGFTPQHKPAEAVIARWFGK